MIDADEVSEIIRTAKENLSMIRLGMDNIPRFRHVQRHGNLIEVVTRTGGGNHHYYDSPWKYQRVEKRERMKDFKQAMIADKKMPVAAFKARRVRSLIRNAKELERKTKRISFWRISILDLIPISYLKHLYRQYKRFSKKWMRIRKKDVFYHGDSKAWADKLRKNPYYIFDVDDDFDCTYCHFVFEVPDQYKMPKDQAEEEEKLLSDWDIRNIYLQGLKKQE